MPMYSEVALKRYPWLWKRDARSRYSCQVKGHRLRSFISQKNVRGNEIVYLRLCKKCDYSDERTAVLDWSGRVRKWINRVRVIPTEKLTPQETVFLDKLSEKLGKGVDN